MYLYYFVPVTRVVDLQYILEIAELENGEHFSEFFVGVFQNFIFGCSMCDRRRVIRLEYKTAHRP
jgi:hypothetical protein